MAEGRDEEELADNKDQRNRPHADKVLHGILVANDHVAGDGIQQHFQHAAGAVLGQHLDKLNADDNIQRPFQKLPHFHTVAVGQQARQKLQQGHHAQQQCHQHNGRKHHFQQPGRLGHLVAKDLLYVFFPAVQRTFGNARFVILQRHGEIPHFIKILLALYHTTPIHGNRKFPVRRFPARAVYARRTL